MCARCVCAVCTVAVRVIPCSGFSVTRQISIYPKELHYFARCTGVLYTFVAPFAVLLGAAIIGCGRV